MHKDSADPLPALTQLEAETTYVLYEQGDAADIIEKVIGEYSLLDLEATLEETRFCLGCDKRQVVPPTPIIMKTSIVNTVLTKDVTNLFSEESSVNNQFACCHCNDALGLNSNDPNNRIMPLQILQRTLINTSDWVVFKVGRSLGGEQRSQWAVSALENSFQGKNYELVACVEHLRIVKKNNLLDHYVTYRRIGGRTFLFDDSQVESQAHELLNNHNVVLVVMRWIASAFLYDVASVQS